MKFGVTPDRMEGVTIGEYNKMIRFLKDEEREHRRANRGG